ncbi:hypothetical protein SKAU_G00202130 [Synaphobranchus kaupii]|uniref:Uncharacterized protein n=1 Tax=Synaphobranchus kaupii TaxID=118154 RepID=A0A9Q1FFQ7_SYNKA|nr:hypothetical protein SKAU_G00202130 [Synaphobranchus kaupii]
MWRWCGLTGNEGAAVKMDRNERIIRMRWLMERRVFLLGLDNSGKSTIYKQLRIIHGEGYSEEERKAFTKTVFQDIFTAMTTLAEAMTTLNIPYSNPENQLHAQCIQDVETSQVTTLEARHTDAIRQLWADPGVRACYSRRREFELLDSTEYYMDNLERMATPDYIPTNQDVVRAKTTYTCLPECSFDFGQNSVR